MKPRSIWKHVLAPTFVLVLSTGSAHAAIPAPAGAEGQATFGAGTSRETHRAVVVPMPESVRDGNRRAEEFDDATQVAARCRARRSRGGTSRSGAIARPSIVNIPSEYGTPKSPKKSSESGGSGGYYDENGVFHGDTESHGSESTNE